MNMQPGSSSAERSTLGRTTLPTRRQTTKDKDQQGIPLRRRYQRVVVRAIWLIMAGFCLWLFIAAIPEWERQSASWVSPI
jgi:hypothetical protein